MGAVDVLILAAGEGTRMKSGTSKVMHCLCGRSMLGWAMEAARGVSEEKPIVVVGANRDAVQQAFGDAARYALQAERLGTGHAVMMAKELLQDEAELVVILAGDMPLLRAETLQQLCDMVRSQHLSAALLSAVLDDPTGYGRVLRNADGSVQGIVEHKDASQAQRAVREINASVYCFRKDALLASLSRLTNDNVQREYYLTDCIGHLAADGQRVGALVAEDARECMGVNNRAQLAEAGAVLRGRINRLHMLSGVTLIDPQNTYIDAQVRIGRDTVIYPGNVLEGACVIGTDCVLYPGSRMVDSTLGNGVTVQNSVLLGARVGANSTVGPYAYLRPGTDVGRHVRIGDFVEVKNSRIDDGTKVSHLTYIGDGHLGRDCNVGCGTVFVNYNGEAKYHTEVGDNVFIGCNSNLIAPVKVGDGAYIAAGSTITDEVPQDALAIARSRQTNKDGWSAKRRAARKKEK